MTIISLPLVHLVRGILKGKRKEITAVIMDRAPVEVAEMTSTGVEDVLGYRASVTDTAFWMDVGSLPLEKASQVGNNTERMVDGYLRDPDHLPVVTLPPASWTFKHETVQVANGDDWRSRFSRVLSSDRDRRLTDLRMQAAALAFVDGRLATSRLRPVGYASDRLLVDADYSTPFRDMLSNRFVSIFERGKGFNANVAQFGRHVEIAGGGRLGGRLPGKRFDHAPFLGLSFLASMEGLDWPEAGIPLDTQAVFALHRLQALRVIEKQGLAVEMPVEEVRELVEAVVRGLDRSNLQDGLMLGAVDRAFESFLGEANNLSASQVPECDLVALGLPHP